MLKIEQSGLKAMINFVASFFAMEASPLYLRTAVVD